MSNSDRVPVPPPVYRKGAWIAGFVVLLLVAGVVGYRVLEDSGKPDECGPGVEVHGPRAECVGVTDGSFVFMDSLRDVEGKIQRENADVVASGKPYVSIVLFVSMTLGDPDIVTPEWVRHHLQGAHLAQHLANHSDALGGPPQVRLLLANPGSRLEQWEPVVAEIERRKDEENIVAVTGIGLSLDTARLAMTRLSEMRMPIVASTLTADDLSDIPGSLRISPTNSAGTRALAAYLKPRAHRAVLVRDENPDDHYAETLAATFPKHFEDGSHEIVGPPERFNSKLPSVENAFLQMMPNICQHAPDLVFFAGRAAHLSPFIAQLANRSCRDDPITVATGDDLSIVTARPDAVRRALQSNITVIHTELAHPKAWAAQPKMFADEPVANFTDRCESCFPTLFPAEPLDDGVAIMAHDAVLTAVRAARLSAGPNPRRVSHEDVLQAMYGLHGAQALSGASGTLSFDEHGDPIDKPVPVMQLRAGASSDFLALSSPD